MTLLQIPQTAHELSSNAQRMLLQLFFLKNVQNREPRRASNGIAAKRTEKLHAIVEGIGDLTRGDNRRERKRIADRLAKNHDVGNHILRFESPEVRAQASKSQLNFIGDADAARCAYVTVHRREITRRKYNLPADAGQCFRNICGDAASFGLCACKNFLNMPRVLCSCFVVIAAIQAAVVISERRDVHPRLLPVPAGAIKFIGADVNQRVRVTVVGVLQNDNVLAAGMGTGKPKRQFIGLAAGIYEEADAQRFREQSRQAFGIAIDVVVQIASVGIEQRKLFLRGFDDARMTVPDKRNVVVHVEIRAARVVIEMLHPAPLDLQWTLVRDAQVFAKIGLASRKRLGEPQLFSWKAIGWNSK